MWSTSLYLTIFNKEKKKESPIRLWYDTGYQQDLFDVDLKWPLLALGVMESNTWQLHSASRSLFRCGHWDGERLCLGVYQNKAPLYSVAYSTGSMDNWLPSLSTSYNVYLLIPTISKPLKLRGLASCFGQGVLLFQQILLSLSGGIKGLKEVVPLCSILRHTG